MEPALARVIDRTSQEDRLRCEQEPKATARAGDGPFAHGPCVATDQSDPEAHIIRSVN